MLESWKSEFTNRLDEFRDIAEPLYRRDPVGNTIELTLLRAGRFAEDALLLTVWDGGAAVGAALQTPPYPLACNGIPTTAHSIVAAELAHVRPDLSGVRGRRDLAVAFADAWCGQTGFGGTITTSEMLYRLATLACTWCRVGHTPRRDHSGPRDARRLGGAILRGDIQSPTR